MASPEWSKAEEECIDNTHREESEEEKKVESTGWSKAEVKHINGTHC